MNYIPRIQIMAKFRRHFRYVNNTLGEFGPASDLVQKTFVSRDNLARRANRQSEIVAIVDRMNDFGG